MFSLIAHGPKHYSGCIPLIRRPYCRKTSIATVKLIELIERIKIHDRCNQSFPCQHQVEVFFKDGTQYLTNKRGVKIWSLLKLEDKLKIENRLGFAHFAIYDNPNLSFYNGPPIKPEDELAHLVEKAQSYNPIEEELRFKALKEEALKGDGYVKMGNLWIDVKPIEKSEHEQKPREHHGYNPHAASSNVLGPEEKL